MRVISDEVYKKFLHSPNMPEPSLRYQKLGCWSTPGFYQVPEVSNDWHLDLSDTPTNLDANLWWRLGDR